LLVRRIGTGASRPLLADHDPGTRLGEILDARYDRYQAAADHRVETDDLTTDQVVQRIEAWWNES
jgi:shikimate kinase